MRTKEAEEWMRRLDQDLFLGMIPNAPNSIAYVSTGHIRDLLSYIKELKIELEVLRAATDRSPRGGVTGEPQ